MPTREMACELCCGRSFKEKQFEGKGCGDGSMPSSQGWMEETTESVISGQVSIFIKRSLVLCLSTDINFVLFKSDSCNTLKCLKCTFKFLMLKWVRTSTCSFTQYMGLGNYAHLAQNLIFKNGQRLIEHGFTITISLGIVCRHILWDFVRSNNWLICYLQERETGKNKFVCISLE